MRSWFIGGSYWKTKQENNGELSFEFRNHTASIAKNIKKPLNLERIRGGGPRTAVGDEGERGWCMGE
ncbi:MAG: hypothetical protein A2W85_09345 [Bacteroidetes bacterium GWF2_41_31]|nr:MAG: hypothetical protein A2W85_09345 [Bacteroidetes bacterium GWF2_41_31]